MPVLDSTATEVRRYRNSRLYRSLTRTLRVYNRRLVSGLHERGFTAFSAAFPQILSNLDVEGTRISVLAARAGVTRQAAGQLVAQIEQSGYVDRHSLAGDARVVIVRFTPLGRELLTNVLELVDEIEADFARIAGETGFEHVREGLFGIAEAIDPVGAFGQEDEPGEA